jgi:hypothetical protein
VIMVLQLPMLVNLWRPGEVVARARDGVGSAEARGHNVGHAAGAVEDAMERNRVVPVLGEGGGASREDQDGGGGGGGGGAEHDYCGFIYVQVKGFWRRVRVSTRVN